MMGLLFSLSFFVVLAVWYGFSSRQHKRTLYYMQTHNSFLATYLNKGLYGEFLTWKTLKDWTATNGFCSIVIFQKTTVKQQKLT